MKHARYRGAVRAATVRGSVACVAAALGAAALAGCQSNVKPFEPIKSVQDFCRHGQAKGSSIMSIVSSLSDTPPSQTRVFAGAAVEARTRAAGGVVAHWNDLNVLLPNLAKTYGDAEGYLHVRAAAIENPPSDAQSRKIRLLIRRDGRETWREFDAFDVQDVCVEGSPKA